MHARVATVKSNRARPRSYLELSSGLRDPALSYSNAWRARSSQRRGIVVLSNAATYFQGDARVVDAVNMATDAYGDAIMAGPRASEFKSQVCEQATRTYGPDALAKMRAPPIALAGLTTRVGHAARGQFRV